MNISLEEQIEYMRHDVDWYKAKVFNQRHGWSEELAHCEAILATLEACKKNEESTEDQDALSATTPFLAPTKPEPGP